MASLASLELDSVPAQVEQPANLPTLAPIAVPTPKQRSTRYQSLDLWRGAACMMLVLYHTSFYVPSEFSVRDWSAGSVASAAVKTANLLWIGVPIFFVVSGYCIAASVDARNRRPYSLKTYFGRRMWRIYPPLWIACVWAIGVTWMISYFWPSLYEACRQLPRWEDWSPWNWAGNFTATESWQHHVTGSRVQYLMNNTWTLCYEEQFYAVVGLLLVIATRRFFTGALVLTGLTLICRHVGRWHDLEQAGWFFEGHWLLFAAGILLYYQLTHAGRVGWWSILGLLLLGIVYAVIDRSLVPGNENERHFDEYVVVACAFALLLLGVRRWDGAFMNAKLLRPLQWCGRRSYSIYLTHFPVVAALSCLMAQIGFTTPSDWLMVTLPLCVAVALVLGWLFHVLVERHFLNAPV
jgi:peptidoglycan/LPS O-acetylase OafA/YrhL